MTQRHEDRERAEGLRQHVEDRSELILPRRDPSPRSRDSHSAMDGSPERRRRRRRRAQRSAAARASPRRSAARPPRSPEGGRIRPLEGGCREDPVEVGAEHREHAGREVPDPLDSSALCRSTIDSSENEPSWPKWISGGSTAGRSRRRSGRSARTDGTGRVRLRHLRAAHGQEPVGPDLGGWSIPAAMSIAGQ